MVLTITLHKYPKVAHSQCKRATTMFIYTLGLAFIFLLAFPAVFAQDFSIPSDFTKIVADVLANPYVRTSYFALIA